MDGRAVLEYWFNTYCKVEGEKQADSNMIIQNPDCEKAAQFIAEDELKMRQDLDSGKKALDIMMRNKQAYEARLKDAQVI